MLAITFTTIYVPDKLLESYVFNFEKFNHPDVSFIITGDLKTPKILQKIATEVSELGYECEFWNVKDQERWLEDYPRLKAMIPYNSDNRRNLGFLRAIEIGAEVIVSIDDDNYALPDEDFYQYHSIVGSTLRLKSIRSSNNWFNPCSLLEFNDEAPVYQRGFPYSKRWDDKYQDGIEEGRVVLNMGLWLGDPDVDAATNLDRKLVSTRYGGEQIMLPPNTFTTINSQNTAFHRSVLPCFYFILMEYPNVNGLKLDRYGDIWQGFFAKKIIDAVGDRVTIGRPITMHNRNTHDPLRDLLKELWGMVINERLVDILERIDLSSKNYFDGYLELSEALEKNRRALGSSKMQKYLSRIVNAMQVWVDVCEKIV